MPRDTTKPWADGPFALIPEARSTVEPGNKPQGSQFVAQEMIIVHNFLLRSANAVYVQAENVETRGTPQDVDDFVHYAQEWATLLHEHHHGEETSMFPQIEELAGEKGIMDGNVAQHAAFHAGLETYEKYVAAVLAGEEKYSGKRLREILDSFMPTLRQHLSDEIDTLLGLARFDKDWAAWYQRFMEEIMKKTADPDLKVKAFPMALTAHDHTFDNGAHVHWPPLPWFVKLLFRFVFSRTHKAWWRFAPCDITCQPRDLPFA